MRSRNGSTTPWPIYRLIRFMANHLARDEELVATIKTLAGLVLYPLVWIGISVAIGIYFAVPSGITAIILLPLSAYVALVVFEAIDDLTGQLRAMRRHDLRAQQRAIRDEIIVVAEELRA